MDSSIINQYLGKVVLLTLKNGFWYKAKIISVTGDSITFIELKGRTISASPDQIAIIEETK